MKPTKAVCPTMRVRLVRWLCSVYVAALTVGLLWPGGRNLTPLPDPLVQRFGILGHFLAFVGLAVLLRGTRLPLRNRVLLAVLVGYALLTEFAQSFLPGRTAMWQDAAANLLGVAVGLAVAWAAETLLGRRHDDDAHRIRPRGGCPTDRAVDLRQRAAKAAEVPDSV